MAAVFVLDAWALVALLQGESPAADRVRALLESAAGQSIRLVMSCINLGEVYTVVGRRRGLPEADETLRLLGRLPLEMLPASDERVLAAARLRMRHRLSFADAFAASAAIELTATLVTGDPELIALHEELPIEPLARRGGST